MLSIIFSHVHQFSSGLYRFSSICVVSSRFFLVFLIFRCFSMVFVDFSSVFDCLSLVFVIFPCFSMFLFGLLIYLGLV